MVHKKAHSVKSSGKAALPLQKEAIGSASTDLSSSCRGRVHSLTQCDQHCVILLTPTGGAGERRCAAGLTDGAAVS